MIKTLNVDIDAYLYSVLVTYARIHKVTIRRALEMILLDTREVVDDYFAEQRTKEESEQKAKPVKKKSFTSHVIEDLIFEKKTRIDDLKDDVPTKKKKKQVKEPEEIKDLMD